MITAGVDVGTSGTKILAMDEHGKVLKIVMRDYPLYQSGVESEQHPDDWWEQTADGLRELTAAVPNIAAVSFSGQMHGLVVLDAEDKVIRRAILWNDQRTTAQCDYLNNVVGREKLLENVANIALTGFTLPKILWMKEHEPELFARIKKVMLPKDYIAYKLSGQFATDESDASGTLLLDVQKREWSQTMLEIAGLKQEQLPKLYKSSAAVGKVTAAAAKLTGLSEDTIVVIGGGDQAVGAVGTGTVSAGMCSLSLGTSGVVFAATDKFAVDRAASAVHSFCHANGAYHMMGVTLGAAASTKWWIEDVLNVTDYNSEQTAIKPENLGNNSVYYLPYLSGERTPINDPFARGAFVGMATYTSRADMTLAILEGVAYSLRDNLEAIKKLGVSFSSARIIGGGAKSALWCQITANVLNLRVDKINSAEGPAFGAAILAAVGAGAYPTVEEACSKLIAVTQSYKPDSAAVQRYEKRYPIYNKLYKDLAESFGKISAG
ncbi:MAG: xylulokinase [Defluviitaleaceae bacterium]|nr:xylulokinase [Defluviitaleaceae bacterium]